MMYGHIERFEVGRQVNTRNRYVSPEAQQGLTSMLDRWMEVLGILEVDDPYSEQAPRCVNLRSEAGETIMLVAPGRDISHPDPVRRGDLGYTNTILAQQEIEGVKHALHVNSSAAPHVLAAEGEQLVKPRTTAEAMLELVLNSEVVRD